MHRGWISIWRMLLDKYIWINSTPEQKVVLITVLLMANHESYKWVWKKKNYEVQPGQFITSINSLVEKCGKGVSVQNVRTALKKFETHGFLTVQSTNENSLVTITNWGEYQYKNTKLTNELTVDQQATNKRLTTNNNDNNDNKNTNTPIFSKEKTIATPVKILHVDVEEVYKKYPTKCLINGNSTGKGAKDKTKIKALLKQHSKNELLETIELYVNDCVATKRFMKNFSTFLNNLPSIESFEGSNSNYINNNNNGNNQITAKERQRQNVTIEVGRGILQDIYDEQNQ